VCGQVVASAEETLTAESVNDVHARLLQVAVNSPVIVIERLARDYAGSPLEWRRSRGHASTSATAWIFADACLCSGAFCGG
jgi:GntR family transcriptional regulator